MCKQQNLAATSFLKDTGQGQYRGVQIYGVHYPTSTQSTSASHKTAFVLGFPTRCLRGRKLINCDLQQWHSPKCSLFFVFCICLSVCRFVKGNIKCRKFAHRFVLSPLKRRSFLTSCVFRFVFCMLTITPSAVCPSCFSFIWIYTFCSKLCGIADNLRLTTRFTASVGLQIWHGGTQKKKKIRRRRCRLD